MRKIRFLYDKDAVPGFLFLSYGWRLRSNTLLVGNIGEGHAS
ncbi:MAG TPA: hypothetical protein VGE25_10155 [Sediminibacterium sp.]